MPRALIWPEIFEASPIGKPRCRWPAELMKPLKALGRLIARSSAVLRVVISPEIAATRMEPMLSAWTLARRLLRSPTMLPTRPATSMTLRKSLVVVRSCGLLVFALIAPSMTRLSTLAAMMPPRWIRPVTGLYIVESVACWLFCVLIRSTYGACPGSSVMVPMATPVSFVECTIAAESWIPPRLVIDLSPATISRTFV